MKPVITTQNLRFTYRGCEQPVLDGVDFSQTSGEFHCIIGPTGAGKSTFLQILNRCVPSFFKGEIKGEVAILETPLGDQSLAEMSRKVGMVFQDFESQIFSTDVLLEVAFGPENMGIEPDVIRQIVSRVLESVGLAGFEVRDTAALSGGEKQRLAIASILAMEPELLIFDEPTTDLDPVGKREVLTVIRSLASQGRSVLLVEHDLEEILETDAVHLLAGGKLLQSGPPQSIFQEIDLLVGHGVRPPEMATLKAGLGLKTGSLMVKDVAIQLADIWFDDGRYKALLEKSPPLVDQTVLDITDVRFGYGEKPVLNGIDLKVNRGEVLAILGQNGSGKTTFIKTLNGLLRPQSGQISLDDKETGGMTVSEIGKRVGYIFQNPDHQIFTPTCRDEICFGLENHGVPKGQWDESVAKALSVVHLSGYEEKDPYILTKGERQRLAVASVLACEPDVIILDEPTTGLDYREQLDMMSLLSDLAQNGHAVVIVTHTMWVVSAYCDRVVVLSEGKVLTEGAVRDVFYQSEALAKARILPPPIVQLSKHLGRRFLTVDEFLSCVSKED